MDNGSKPPKSIVSQKEEVILQFWQKNKIFEKSLEKTKDGEPFVFYDGPPFATGLPHYGHLVASAMKDAIPRYQTMCGRHVERRWGWDCHGLPIENIVEKELGTKSKKEIEEMGIGKFNKLCREKIFTYVDAWNKFIPRFGRWADMEKPYKTMDASYMESEWWAFKKLYDSGLIYKDYRSMHICPRCETTLAQAEVAEGYQTIKDLSVVAKFELESQPGTYVLAWTTTPWTLPGNVALAVGEEVTYQKVKIKDENGLVGVYILAKDRVSDVCETKDHETAEEIKGKDLVGKSYKPLFDNYSKDKSLENRENGWKIYSAPFVNTEDGTGVVHIAPAFGEDDMALGKEKKLPFVQHVGMDGVISDQVKELAGLHVKPKEDHQSTDIEIVKLLAKKNLLFSKEKYEHSYPHCWRCDTPLINYATSSWFVSVTKIKDDVLKYAKKINWSPSHIKSGRWNEWLEGARDWSISRQRYWANTIPVWENEETGERLVIGSVEELIEYTKKTGNKYFVMRHGEADNNILKIYSSAIDNKHHLTDGGRKQIEDALKNLKGKKIDTIISSPFARTRETAEIVAEGLGISSSEIVFDKRIGEVNWGEVDGKDDTDHEKNWEDPIEKFEKPTSRGGETWAEVKKRCGDFLYDIDSQHRNKNILIISHDDVCFMLCASGTGLDRAEVANIETSSGRNFIKNAEVKDLQFRRLPHNEEYELDLHRPYIDEFEVINENGVRFKRVTDVLDTWFDSGSVPFSSYHYPFENKKEIESRIPADFIAEGQDQVSKWFYYQHVLSGGLFKCNAFSNVIVNGIVLAEDGKKMSKRLQNYPDPTQIVNKYSADAIRYYLLSSPVVRADSLNFSEKGVDDVQKKVLMRLLNVVSFYEMYKSETVYPSDESENVLDQWIVARTRELLNDVEKGLDLYELDTATRPIAQFVDDLSTWYLRRSRDRFKSDNEKEKMGALQTTNYVLLTLSKVIAPFLPFVAEDIYKRAGGEKESVHLEEWPSVSLKSKSKDQNEEILKEMKMVRGLVSFALELREKEGIKIRQPLSKITLGNKFKDVSESYYFILEEELNVKKVFVDKKIKNIQLDITITPELKEEGDFREFVRQVQDLRKKENLSIGDKVTLKISTDKNWEILINKFRNELREKCLLKDIIFEKMEGEKITIGETEFKIKLEK